MERRKNNLRLKKYGCKYCLLDFITQSGKIELSKGVDKMKIGETILKLREAKQMSQEEFAQHYHVTRQMISNWEKEVSQTKGY